MSELQRKKPQFSSRRRQALEQLLRYLDEHDYDFVTPTPATLAIVVARRAGESAADLRDLLGWSLPFRAGGIDPRVERLLERADALAGPPQARRATIRVSRLHGRLFLHSAYPTSAADSVFFGPDSYRFADLVRGELAAGLDRAPVIVDIGTGAGVGAVVAGTAVPRARLVATDLNPAALELACVNARAAEISLDVRCGDLLAGYSEVIDVALANPPYIVDPAARLYRHGGGLHGAELTIRIAEVVLPRLAERGRFILYSGSAIVAGRDRLRQALGEAAARHACALEYREIDPDLFGEELATPAYAEVERIAAVAALFRRQSRSAAA